MCGLSGYIGLSADKQTRLMLVLGLADGIDNRGGHSCGYVSVANNGDLNFAKKSGVWVRSRLRFIEGAANDICLMHARFATCGDRYASENAHPFAIRRNGRVVMWGAHNGMVPDAFKSAQAHGRKIEVDSQEIFELLADGDIEGLQDLAGYGVITWIDADYRDRVFLSRLSTHSDIILVSIKGGGYVWASTKRILTEALKFADLEADREFDLSEIGRVFQITPEGVFKTEIDGVRVGNYDKWKKKHSTSTVEEVSAAPPPEKIDVTIPVNSREFKEETFSYPTGGYMGYGAMGDYYEHM